MMRKNWKNILLYSLLIQLLACKEPYDPSIESGIVNFLVVEGFINTSGITSIQLSRTLQLAEEGAITAELGASVQIEGDNNTAFPLNHSNNGFYTSSALSLPADAKYRLRIKTIDGKEYVSDYESVRATPDMNVSWEKSAAGVQLFVSSGDDKNNTRYYQWAYEETWEIKSSDLSRFVARRTPTGVSVSERGDTEQANMFRCWGNSRSNSILTTSTVALSNDVVDRYPLVFIPNGSDKLAVRYSLMVKQFAITREAYEFSEHMKKNSEQMGTVFDPQPSQVTGNIRCLTDSAEPVIGFIVAASAVEKRIFLTSTEVGEWKSSLECGSLYIENKPDSLNWYFRDDRYLITTGVPDENSVFPRMLGYYATQKVCLDCRERGSSERPGFW